MAGRYCEGKIKMASEKVSRKMVLEIKYVNANNAVIHTENSKLLLDLNCSPKELEKKTVVNSCGIEHPAAKQSFSGHSIELYYVDHVEPAPINVTTTAAVKAETVSQTRIVQMIELVFVYMVMSTRAGRERVFTSSMRDFFQSR